VLSLAYPWILLLAVLPLLFRQGKGQSAAVEAPVLPMGHWLTGLPGVSRSGSATPRWQKVMLLLCWLLMVVALARPQHAGETVQVPVSGRDMLLDPAGAQHQPFAGGQEGAGRLYQPPQR
jgi:Ca-activated chloride channel family protein